jgi:predicted dehydrogenase
MSTRSYNIGVACLVHDHIWRIIDGFAAHAQCRLNAFAEAAEDLQAQFLNKYPGTRCYQHWGEMIDSEKLDILVVTTENCRTAEIAEYAAARGIHLLIEKPMAATLEQAERILSAAKKHGVRLLINWHPNWYPAMQTSFRLLREGAIGQVYDVRIRRAHLGPREVGCTRHFYEWLYDEQRNGGGAFVDLGCYGANICRLLLGYPKEVIGWRQRLVKTDIEVDDNGTILMVYDQALGRSEASWCEVPPYYDSIFLGSSGTIVTENNRVLISTDAKKQPQPIDNDALPPHKQNAANHFIHCLENDCQPEDMCCPMISRDAMEIMAAGLLSDREKRRVALPLN